MSDGDVIPRRERIAMIRRAFVDSVPVLMGYTTMGFVAGVLLAAKGNVVLSPLWENFQRIVRSALLKSTVPSTYPPSAVSVTMPLVALEVTVKMTSSSTLAVVLLAVRVRVTLETFREVVCAASICVPFR